MRLSLTLLTLASLATQGALAQNASHSKKVENKPKQTECNWNGSTHLNAGFSYSSLTYQFPTTFDGTTFLKTNSVDCSGPKASLEQTFGYSGLFNISLQGSFTDLYTAAGSMVDRSRGYIVEGEGKVSIPFLLSKRAQMHMSIIGGFAARQTFARSDEATATELAANDNNVFYHKVRYMTPLAGLSFDLKPSERSYADFGISVLFPRARHYGYDLTTATPVTDHLSHRQHGWSAEYNYSYQLSAHLSFSAKMQYKHIQVYGNSYERDSDGGYGTARSYVYERDVSGVIGLCLSY